MKKIANIVSLNTINVSKVFNVVKTFDEIIEGLPTLIVDYDYVCKHYPDFDIAKCKIDYNLYWTFKKTQNRDKHAEDLAYFINKVYVDLIKDVPYFYLDFIQYQPSTIVKAIRKIKNFKKTFTYHKDNIIYIYGEKIVFGVDLRLLKYMGYNTDKLINKIKANSDVFLVDDAIFIEYAQIVEELENQVRYIPYLLSITHEENNTTSIIHIPREGGVVS